MTGLQNELARERKFQVVFNGLGTRQIQFGRQRQLASDHLAGTQGHRYGANVGQAKIKPAGLTPSEVVGPRSGGQLDELARSEREFQHAGVEVGQHFFQVGLIGPGLRVGAQFAERLLDALAGQAIGAITFRITEDFEGQVFLVQLDQGPAQAPGPPGGPVGWRWLRAQVFAGPFRLMGSDIDQTYRPMDLRILVSVLGCPFGKGQGLFRLIEQIRVGPGDAGGRSGLVDGRGGIGLVVRIAGCRCSQGVGRFGKIFGDLGNLLLGEVIVVGGPGGAEEQDVEIEGALVRGDLLTDVEGLLRLAGAEAVADPVGRQGGRHVVAEQFGGVLIVGLSGLIKPLDIQPTG